MVTQVLMPALSPTMTEGKIARWLKSEGDPVHSGDVLAEIETDKATMEVEAVDEGVLAKIVIPEGTDHVAVNTPIAVISGDVLAEIETDKATMEVEAVDEGVLAKIVIPEGTDHVAVNTPIAVIAGD